MNIRDKIKLAIDRTEGAGDTSYEKGCVIGQIFLMEGYTKETLRSFDESGYPALVNLPVEHIAFLERRGYPIDLLQDLQHFWDWYDSKERLYKLLQDCLPQLNKYSYAVSEPLTQTLRVNHASTR